MVAMNWDQFQVYIYYIYVKYVYYMFIYYIYVKYICILYIYILYIFQVYIFYIYILHIFQVFARLKSSEFSTRVFWRRDLPNSAPLISVSQSAQEIGPVATAASCAPSRALFYTFPSCAIATRVILANRVLFPPNGRLVLSKACLWKIGISFCGVTETRRPTVLTSSETEPCTSENLRLDLSRPWKQMSQRVGDVWPVLGGGRTTLSV